MTEAKPASLKQLLRLIDWGKYLQYGSVKVTIREGKPTLITVETTDRLD